MMSSTTQQDESKQKSSADGIVASSSSSATTSPPVSSANLPPLPTFSPELQSALQDVLPSTDPLDSPSFDAITYINSAFPDESSLSGNKLEVFLTNLRRQVKHYNDIIIHDVRDHSCQRNVTKDAVDHATTSITQLFNKIKQIKEKAAESEIMVQEICRDIRSLDHAKQHLTSTIRALRNLHMLVSAVGQLDYMVTEKQYRDAARLIKAIDDLFSLFQNYKHIEKIKLLQQNVSTTKELMKEQLTNEFHRLLPTLQPLPSSKPVTPRYQSGIDDPDEVAPPPVDADEQQHIRIQLADACELVNVLDPAFKHTLLLWFASRLLEDYNGLYAYGKEGATMEQIDRRYAWYTRMIQNYDNTYLSIFPLEWEVPLFIGQQFTKITKQQISRILTAPDKKLDVTQMIKALTKTIEFERRFTYDIKMRRAPEDRGAKMDMGIEEAGQEMEHEDLVENIKMKYKKRVGEDSRASLGAAPGATASARKAATDDGNIFDNSASSSSSTTTASTAPTRPALPPVDFHGSISDAFTPYMSSYVELERKSINDICDKVDREEKWNSPEESKSKDRYGGSDDLFLYMKNSIHRCSKLTKNITFFHLYQEYKRGLSLYVDMLERHLPKKTIDFTSTLSEREHVTCCYIVNTAEYCSDTIPMLENSIKNIIDTQYKADINLSSLCETYSILINKSVQILVVSISNNLNRVLNNMAKNNWEVWQSVGDESSYVIEMVKIFKESLPLIHRHLSPRFLPFFCNQLAASFIPKYIDAIYRCKRIGEMGAQQMSLDAHSLKSTLLSLPTLTMDADSTDPRIKRPTASKSYTKYVTTEMSKAEALLKTLVSPTERLIVTFKALLPKSPVDDLNRICALRGMNKKEIATIVEQYNSGVSVEDQVRLPGSGSATSAVSATSALAGLPGLNLSSVKGPNLRSFISNLGS